MQRPPRHDLSLLEAVDVTGAARDEYERAYFRWLYVSLSDSCRRVATSPAFSTSRRARLLDEILARMESVFEEVLALEIDRARLAREQP